ncbi:hypothetical protein C5167_050321, partial [Papaver somniferum]
TSVLNFVPSHKEFVLQNKGAGLVTKKAKLNVRDDREELNEEKTNTDDTACAICDHFSTSGGHLHVLPINAINVNKQKIVWYVNCSLQYADVVQRHITVNACREKLGLVQRAWDNLLPRNRILLYCQNHKIEKDQGTPSRNHIVFPNVEVKAKLQSTQSGQQRVLKRKRMIPKEVQESTSVRPRNSVEMMAPSKQSKFVDNKPKRFSVQQLVSTKRLSTCSASKVIPKDSFKPVIDLSYKQQKVLARPICSKPLPDAEAGKRSNCLYFNKYS